MDSNKSQAYGGSAPLPLVFVFTSGTFWQKVIIAKENVKLLLNENRKVLKAKVTKRKKKREKRKKTERV